MSQLSVLKIPSIDDLKLISDKAKLKLTEGELLEYRECIAGTLEDYKKLEEIVDLTSQVKYHRSPGHRPADEENPHNAWWYKTDIKGADHGKLLGRKIAIKDSIMVADVPMINGSYIFDGYVPDEDASVVKRILDEGGHIIGKSTCENLCCSGNSFTSATGPVTNPHDPTRSAGGSSSGNAVLLHLGEVDFAVGNDHGGSVRTPSSWCGTVGLKPTYGLVPYTGAVPGEPTIDHVGPMTRNVKDCALLLEVIAGYDGTDFRQPRGLKVPEYSKLLTGDISGMKIAVLKEGFLDCEKDVIETIKSAIKIFEKCGASTTEVSIPQHKTSTLFGTIVSQSSFITAMQNSGAIHGVKGHQNLGLIDHLRSGIEKRANLMIPSQKLSYLLGTYMTENYGLRYTVKAHNLLPQLIKAYDDVLQDFSVIIMPTLPFKAPKLPNPEECTVKEYLGHCFGMTANTKLFNITGHPALTLNAGYSEGLPIGIQIVGKHWDETTVLNVAYALETALVESE